MANEKSDELAARRTLSQPDQGDRMALEDAPHRASEAEIAAMPEGSRRAFLAQRARNDAAQAARDAYYARAFAAERASVNRANRVSVWLQSTFGFPWGPLRNGLRRKR